MTQATNALTAITSLEIALKNPRNKDDIALKVAALTSLIELGNVPDEQIERAFSLLSKASPVIKPQGGGAAAANAPAPQRGGGGGGFGDIVGAARAIFGFGISSPSAPTPKRDGAAGAGPARAETGNIAQARTSLARLEALIQDKENCAAVQQEAQAVLSGLQGDSEAVSEQRARALVLIEVAKLGQQPAQAGSAKPYPKWMVSRQFSELNLVPDYTGTVQDLYVCRVVRDGNGYWHFVGIIAKNLGKDLWTDTGMRTFPKGGRGTPYSGKITFTMSYLKQAEKALGETEFDVNAMETKIGEDAFAERAAEAKAAADAKKAARAILAKRAAELAQPGQVEPIPEPTSSRYYNDENNPLFNLRRDWYESSSSLRYVTAFENGINSYGYRHWIAMLMELTGKDDKKMQEQLSLTWMNDATGLYAYKFPWYARAAGVFHGAIPDACNDIFLDTCKYKGFFEEEDLGLSWKEELNPKKVGAIVHLTHNVHLTREDCGDRNVLNIDLPDYEDPQGTKQAIIEVVRRISVQKRTGTTVMICCHTGKYFAPRFAAALYYAEAHRDKKPDAPATLNDALIAVGGAPGDTTPKETPIWFKFNPEELKELIAAATDDDGAGPANS